ncbi:MAG: DUF4139 domain-containing protein [Fimbriimonadaceae bacterium]
MIVRIALCSMAAATCGFAATGCVSRGLAAAPEAGAASRNVELTVYKGDFAMVREQRPVNLEAGQNKLNIIDVSRKLDPSSVLFTWQNPGSADVVSNTYDLGMSSGRDLLKRYVGQQVDVVHYGQNGQRGEKLTGTLEVATNNSLVLNSDGKYIVDPEGTVMAPNRSDIVAMSQLAVGVDSKTEQSTNLGVAYLTGGLGWTADYVATVDPNGNTTALECWATVTNQTGIAFPAARMTLVAGSPNRAVNQYGFAGEIGGAPAASPPSAKAENERGTGAIHLSPSATGELYAYPIASPATIAPGEMNRVRMLASTVVPVTKDYSVRLDASSAYSGRPIRQNATLTINFTNSEASKLGMPLPQGTVRAYEADGAGAAQYIGAANIPDTPKDQLVSLTLSNVFDVTSQAKLVRTRRLDKHHVQQDYSVTLANAKSVPVELRVVQGFYQPFAVVNESLKSRRLNAGEAQWMATIPPSGHVILTYSVRLAG